MKKVTLVIIFLLISITSYAADWEVEARLNYFTYSNPLIRPELSQEIRLHRDWLFVSFGKENFMLYPANLSPMSITFESIGLGTTCELFKHLRGFAMVAYYDPKGDGDMLWEDGYYFMNSKWAWIHGMQSWDRYELILDSAFGVSFGLDYKRKLWEMIDVGIGVSCRYLKINEEYNSYQANGQPAWVYVQQGDYNAVIGTLMISISYPF